MDIITARKHAVLWPDRLNDILISESYKTFLLLHFILQFYVNHEIDFYVYE